MINKALPVAAGIVGTQLASKYMGAQLAKIPVPLSVSTALVGVAAGILVAKFIHV